MMPQVCFVDKPPSSRRRDAKGSVVAAVSCAVRNAAGMSPYNTYWRRRGNYWMSRICLWRYIPCARSISARTITSVPNRIPIIPSARSTCGGLRIFTSSPYELCHQLSNGPEAIMATGPQAQVHAPSGPRKPYIEMETSRSADLFSNVVERIKCQHSGQIKSACAQASRTCRARCFRAKRYPARCPLAPTSPAPSSTIDTRESTLQRRRLVRRSEHVQVLRVKSFLPCVSLR